METLKSGDVPALVTNIEVMSIVRNRIEKRQQEDELLADSNRTTKKGGKLRHRDFIEESVYAYLQTTPCAYADFQQMPELISRLDGTGTGTGTGTTKHNNNESQQLSGTNSNETPSPGEGSDEKFSQPDNISESRGFSLTDADKLQILNHMPSEAVEIHLMVEELSSRMDEERQNELLRIISEYAGGAPVVDETVEEGTMEEVVEEALL